MKLTEFELAALDFMNKYDASLCPKPEHLPYIPESTPPSVAKAIMKLRRIASDSGLFKKAMEQKHEEKLALLPRKPCTQWIWAKNDDCLKNGSFIRQDWNGHKDETSQLSYHKYSNGDYMEELQFDNKHDANNYLDVNYYKASDPEYAQYFVPKSCQVKI
jgi:hypothetical protein